MGVDKREILYLGDVINTASRLATLQDKLQLDSNTDKIYVTDELIKSLKQIPLYLKIVPLGVEILQSQLANRSIYLIQKRTPKSNKLTDAS